MQKQRVLSSGALLVVWLLAGCRTPPPPAAVVPVPATAVTQHVAAAATAFVLSPAAQLRAQALAEFADGRLAEINKDSAEAVEHYLAAAQLEPDNESLQMRTAQGLLQQNRNQEALTILRALVEILKAKKVRVHLAALGGDIEVPTIHGWRTLKVPAGTASGTVLRMRNEGLNGIRGLHDGDQHVRVTIEVPVKLDGKQRERFAEFLQHKQAMKK